MEVKGRSYTGRSVMTRVSFALLALAAAAPLRGQSLLYRGPNMGGSWVPDPAVVQFNFLHRFYVAPGPSHAVVNYPSFTLAAGIAHGIAFGGKFATKSLAGTGDDARGVTWPHDLWNGIELHPLWLRVHDPVALEALQSVVPRLAQTRCARRVRRCGRGRSQHDRGEVRGRRRHHLRRAGGALD